MPHSYLLELLYQDGRVDTRPSGPYRGSVPFEIGARVEVDGLWWTVLDKDAAAGYDAKFVLDEE